MKIILLFDIEIVYIKNIREWAEWKFLRAESGILSADSLHENARCSRMYGRWLIDPRLIRVGVYIHELWKKVWSEILIFDQ